MSVGGLAVALLLAAGTVTVILCCVALLLTPDPFDRLHFLSVAGLLGPVLIVAAIVIHAGPAVTTVKSIVVLLVLVVTGPVLVHATGRAARIESMGGLEIRPGEWAEREEEDVPEGLESEPDERGNAS